MEKANVNGRWTSVAVGNINDDEDNLILLN